MFLLNFSFLCELLSPSSLPTHQDNVLPNVQGIEDQAYVPGFDFNKAANENDDTIVNIYCCINCC